LEEARVQLLFRLPRFEVRGHRGTAVVCSRATLIGSGIALRVAFQRLQQF
jgi:hypothetical protein